nr:MAG TPA: hypothetical protein [Caudoviricetes sp.]
MTLTKCYATAVWMKVEKFKSISTANVFAYVHRRYQRTQEH